METDKRTEFNYYANFAALGLLGQLPPPDKKSFIAEESREDLAEDILKNLNGYQYKIRYMGGVKISEYHSPQCLEITGYSPEEYSRDRELWIKMVHPEDRGKVHRMVSESLLAEQGVAIEHRLIRKDGRVAWVSNFCKAELNENQRPVLINGILMDITAWKKEQEELASLNRALWAISHLSETVPDTEKEIDLYRKAVWNLVNTGDYKAALVGITPRRSPQKKPHIVALAVRTDAEDLCREMARTTDLVLQPAVTAQRSKRGVRINDIGVDPHFSYWKECGLHRYFSSLYSTPLKENGKVFATLTVFSSREGAFQKQETGVLNKYAGFLRQGVLMVRNRQIRKKLDQALLEAKEKAENALKVREKFLSLIAHDLRSPVSTTIGYLQVLEQKLKVGESLEATAPLLPKALDVSRHTLEILDDLLNISRFRSGKIKPLKTFFDLSFVAEGLLQEMRFLAEKKGVFLACDVPEFTRFYADRTLLKEVLRNLLSNAIKFCDRGDSVLIYSPKPGVVSVRDTGRGIQPEFLNKLYDCHTQTSTTGTAGEKGTGLGLPLCKDIVDAHGGRISFVTQVKKGTAFTLTLPFRKPTLLVVDDILHCRELLIAMLQQLDVTILEAADGREALHLMQDKMVDLVISDYQMKPMDGLDLMKETFQRFNRQDVRFILTTASRDMEVRGKALAGGAHDFIATPVDPADMIPRVRRLIG